MLAELHCHSIYSTGRRILSEGSAEPKDIVHRAKKLGLGCLAITDHDTMDGYEKARVHARKAGIILIPGEEITTREGHMIALGIKEAVKPHLSLDESIDAVHKQGGICVAAHPFDRRRHGMGDDARKCDAIEAFNAITLDRMPNFYAIRFAEALGKPKTAGSDAHSLAMLGHARNKIDADSIEACLKAIKKGRVSISGEYIETDLVVEWMIERLRYSYYYTTNYMKNNYRQPKKFFSLKLMRLVKRDYRKMDYLFRLAGYAVLGGVLTYSIAKNTLMNAAAKMK